MRVWLCLFAASGLAVAQGCKSTPEGSDRRCETIGAGGGTVTSHDRFLNLAIRPDALSENVEVCISPADRPPGGPPFVYGPAYRVTPDVDLGINAIATYQHQLPTNTDGVSVGVVRRADFEAGSGKWLALPVTRLEPENNLVAGSDSRLSMFYGLCQTGDCEGDIPDPTVADTTVTDTTTGPTTDSTSGDPTTTPDDDDASATALLTEGSSSSGEDPTTGEGTSSSSDDGESTSSSSSSSSSTGSDLDCDALPDPPFTITSLGNVFPQSFMGIGSEDLAMTGNGTFVAASDMVLLESDEDGNTSEWYDGITAGLFGLRFNVDGDILAINTGTENVDIFDGASQQAYVVTGWVAANGLYADHQGDTWASDFANGSIYRVNSDLSIDTITDEVDQPNGVFFDENRSILYWSRYNFGELHAIPIDGAGDPGDSELVVNLAGQTDGITMDACGHIYAVDQAGGGGGNPCRIDRVHLTAEGDLAVEGVVEVAGAGDLGNGCSNAQFGFGFGDENDESLFVISIPGDVHIVNVGVPGYAIP